jgi:cardiolipin synthase
MAFEMQKLLEIVAAVACLVSPEKVETIASRIRQTDTTKASNALSNVVSTPAAANLIHQLIDAWRTTTVSADELASMLLSASHVFAKVSNQQSVELVWTGPKTPFVSARRTEQALLQVINSAEQTLFITSFVAYDISSIVKALNDASDRGVAISMLLELSQDHGGSITFDVISKMRMLVPTAKLYAWKEKSEPFTDGRVHAKVAVADSKICFITSANLTAYAMEKNIETGVLLSGGKIPQLLNEHLNYLVTTNSISQE